MASSSSSPSFVFSNLAPVCTAFARSFPSWVTECEQQQLHPSEHRHHVFAAAIVDPPPAARIRINLVLALRGSSSSSSGAVVESPLDFIHTRGTQTLFESTSLLPLQNGGKATLSAPLRLIPLSPTAVLVVAALDDGRVFGWKFSGGDASPSDQRPGLLRADGATLLCLHSKQAVRDVAHIRSPDGGTIFIVIVGGCACTVTRLDCSDGDRVRATRHARHFTPPAFAVAGREERVRFILDPAKQSLSLVFNDASSRRVERRVEAEEDGRAGAGGGGGGDDDGGASSTAGMSRATTTTGGTGVYRPPQERIFETHFLPGIFSSATAAAPQASWAGRYAVARGSGQCEPPLMCGRRLWIEDADTLRTDFRRAQDQELAERVLPLVGGAAAAASFSGGASGNLQRCVLEESVLRAQGGWLNGGAAIIAPDVCSVLVDFRRIVALVRAVAPAGGVLAAAAAPSSSSARLAQRVASSAAATADDEEDDEQRLINQVVLLCDSATRLLLARPDIRHPELNVMRNSSGSGSHFDAYSDALEDACSDVDAASSSSAASSSRRAAPSAVFSPRVVARIPHDVVDRAIFSVHATAVALAIPSRAYCPDNDFALAGIFCEVTWPTDRAKELPEFLHVVVRYLLHADCSRVRDASRCFFGACLDRLTAAEKYLLQDALCTAWHRGQQQQQQSSSPLSSPPQQLPLADDTLLEPVPRPDRSTREASASGSDGAARGGDTSDDDQDAASSAAATPAVSPWKTLATTMAPTQALIALLLLVRSVRPASVSPASINSINNSSTSAAASPLHPASLPVAQSSGNGGSGTNSNNSTLGPSAATAAVAASDATAALMLTSPSLTLGGFTPQDLDELGKYSPDSVIELVGNALCTVAKEYRCRSAVSVANGIALRIISEGWGTFSGYIPPAERRSVICRLLMDAVVRVGDSPQQLQQLQQQQLQAASGVGAGGLLQQAELNATQPLVRMVARICATIPLSKTVELFAWCCALSDPEVVAAARSAGLGARDSSASASTATAGASSAAPASSSSSSLDGAHVGISIAALRVLNHVIELHPQAARRHVHSILSFVWAALDPAGSAHSSASSFFSSGAAGSAVATASAFFSSVTSGSKHNSQSHGSGSGAGHSAATNVTSSAVRTAAAKLSVVAQLFRTAVEFIPSFAFHQQSQRVAASAGDDGKIVLYDAKTTSKLATATATWGASSSAGAVAAIAFSPSGDMLVVLSGDATLVSVWAVAESTALFGLLTTSVSLTKEKEVRVPTRTATATAAAQQLQQQPSVGSASSTFSRPSPFRIIVASPKCAIVSFGAGDDVLVNF